MPKPGGKPRVGEHVINTKTGERFLVIGRSAAPISYTLRLRAANNQKYTVTEFDWWLETGHWRIEEMKDD